MSDAFQKFAAIGSRVNAVIDGYIGRFVALANPATYARFRQAANDLGAVLGQILAPVLVRVTSLVRKLADWVLNLSPASKAAVRVLGAVAVVFGVVSATLLPVVFGIGLLRAALNGLGNAAIVNAAKVRVANAAGGGGSAAAAVAGTLGRSAGLLGRLGSVLRVVGSVAARLAGPLAVIWAVFEGIGRSSDETGVRAGRLWTRIEGMFGSLWGVISPVLDGVWKLIKGVYSAFTWLMGKMVDGLAVLLTPLGWLADAIGHVGDKILGLMKDLRLVSRARQVEPRTKKLSSVGAAAASASVVGIEEIGRSAMTAGFGAGRESAELRQAKMTNDHLSQIVAYQRNAAAAAAADARSAAADRDANARMMRS